MTILTARIPDILARQIEELATREDVPLDHLVAIALASQVAGWETRNSIEQRALRGSGEALRRTLDRVPSRPPLEGDEL